MKIAKKHRKRKKREFFVSDRSENNGYHHDLQIKIMSKPTRRELGRKKKRKGRTSRKERETYELVFDRATRLVVIGHVVEGYGFWFKKECETFQFATLIDRSSLLPSFVFFVLCMRS
jgi:hypothetical protein